MKKLGKLKLNPEKMLNHDELVNFRGGSGYPYCSSLSVETIEWCFWDQCNGDDQGMCFDCCMRTACGEHCS